MKNALPVALLIVGSPGILVGQAETQRLVKQNRQVWPRPDRRILDRYKAAGIDRVMLGLPSEGADEILRRLDECVELAGLEPAGSD